MWGNPATALAAKPAPARSSTSYVVLKSQNLKQLPLVSYIQYCAACRKQYGGHAMPTPGWYKTQIETGRERLVCRLIEHECKGITVPEDVTPTQTTQPLLVDCFSPTFKPRQKFKGEWRDVEKRLLPGYIVVVTPDPAALAQRLRAIPRFTRLLSFMNEFVPLREDELRGSMKTPSPMIAQLRLASRTARATRS